MQSAFYSFLEQSQASDLDEITWRRRAFLFALLDFNQDM